MLAQAPPSPTSLTEVIQGTLPLPSSGPVTRLLSRPGHQTPQETFLPLRILSGSLPGSPPWAGRPRGAWGQAEQGHPWAGGRSSCRVTPGPLHRCPSCSEHPPFLLFSFILFTSSREALPDLLTSLWLWLGDHLTCLTAPWGEPPGLRFQPSRQADRPPSRHILCWVPSLTCLGNLFAGSSLLDVPTPPTSPHRPAPLTAEDLASFSTEDRNTARRELPQMPPPGPPPATPSICLPATTDTPRQAAPPPLQARLQPVSQPAHFALSPGSFSPAHRRAGALPTLRTTLC